MTFAATAGKFKTLRASVMVSQSELSRISGVPRWKINDFELGGRDLTDEEFAKLTAALEARRREQLHNLTAEVVVA